MIRSYANLMPRYEPDGGVVLEPAAPPAQVAGVAGHFQNFASYDVSSNIDVAAAAVMRMVESDAASREPFAEEASRFLKLLGTGAEADADEPDYPEGDTSTHHLLALAHTRFMARTLAEMLPPDRVVRAVPVMDLSDIEDPTERDRLNTAYERARVRVEEFYYDYLMFRLPDYVEGLDRTLSDVSLFGMGHRKIYRDPTFRSAPVRVEHVPVEDLTFSFVDACFGRPRRTHHINMPAQELVRRMNAGIYRTIDVSGSTGMAQSPITVLRDRLASVRASFDSGRDIHALAEVHLDLFFEGDPHPAGLARPYVVTLHTQTNQVLAFRRNWMPDDPDETPIQNFRTYVYHPGHRPGVSIGLGHLLGNMTQALTRGQRRAFDAAMLANKPVGFKASSFTIRDDARKYLPGTLIDVDAPGGRIQDAIMLQPFRGPDPGLLQLLSSLETQGKELGGVATADFDQLMKSGVAAGPAMAAFDQTHEFDTAVHRRIYRVAEAEANDIHSLMRVQYGTQPVPFGDGKMLRAGDLLLCAVKPAMRPGHATRQRKMLEAESVYQKAATHPDQHDMRGVLLFYYEALGLERPERFLSPPPEDAKPADLVTEYMRAMKGLPLAVGAAQNHSAHIDGHLAQLQGLQGSKMPVQQGEMISVAIAAHIADHLAWQLAVDVAATLGMTPDVFLEGIPPEIEYQIAPAMAAAVRAVEQMRAAPNDADIRLQIEELRAQNKLAVEQLRLGSKAAELAQRDRTNDKDNATDLTINREDNATALIIASIRQAGGAGAGMRTPSTNPSAGAPTNNASPNARPST